MMALTAKARYAARIMVYLARRSDVTSVTKRDIAKAEDISENYVEQIMISLRAGGLVRSHRGRNGGFSLGRPAQSITLSDVLRAVEGPISPAPCLSNACERAPNCPTKKVWQEAAEAVEKVLIAYDLADLARQSDVDAGALSYNI